LALAAIALTVLEAYGMSNASNNRKVMPSLYSMENGEVDSYGEMCCSMASNDEQMDQRTLSALSYLSRG
jgi:hypothetical protein